MSFKARLFVLLWSAGMAGVLSFLLVDLTALVALVPVTAGTRVPTITPSLKLLSLVQPALMLSLAVLAGVALAPRVGLTSPAAEALTRGGRFSPALRPQIMPGVAGGLAGGAAIVLTALASRPFMPPEVSARISALGRLLPLPTRLLYGGVTEELLLRWGLMTVLVWVAWRLFQRGQGRPRASHFVVAILISSVVFGLGHLPLAFMLLPEATLGLTLYVIVANSLFGLIAGYLYWRRGLEAAVLAHMLAHLVMLAASYLGAYF